MTTTAIPPTDLAAMRARTEAASPGPWTVLSGGHGRYVDHELTGPPRSAHGGFFKRDADFIAHARRDLPAALNEINRLRTRVTELELEATLVG
ncbi:hypothetical protein LO763_22205 [Glycomyces sp. A-F 0318]|uniref:hypothetical protein n=1 Tax=Glycomyces amatae TaxID=2881355 RepID=UPI001E5BB78A|nr:hypothetical protein [Glycomyces amatae]MCD0446331.1 hypothetical protein [Glycomyces amatae]